MAHITQKELLERLFHEDYERLKNKKLRITVKSLEKRSAWPMSSASPSPVSIRTWGFISASMKGKIIGENPSA